MEFAALWKFRRTLPDVPRAKVPGGTLGLILVTLGPVAVILLAIYSQVVEEGMNSLGLALIAMLIGALLYLPIRKFIKPGKPDIDPFEAGV
jgi:hypothetical protein